MEFKILGQYYDIDQSKIIDSAQGVSPMYTDARNKFYVDIEGRQYPIKQLISLVTSLRNGRFTAQYAERILTKIGFRVKEFGPPPPRPQRSVRETLITKKYEAPPESKTAIRFAVTLEWDEDGYITASCPALVGCHSQGRSRSEAIKNIHEAIRGYIASMATHGQSVPDVDWEVVEVAA